jgi:2,4-dienoyl-CoA reductase-like NADH-dependent reductase (Old Yellow Enzyme family)/thioredoxin reductase
MGTITADTRGEVTDRVVDYYTARARGGAALITVELTDVHPDAHIVMGERGHLGIFDDRFISGLRRLTDGIHAAGARCSVQLQHSGRAMFSQDPSRLPVAPSAIPCPLMGQKCRALTIGEIEELVEAFSQGARRARESGFDAVDIHGAHGYLIAQFMSADSNRRSDEYGGDLTGRLRFPCEVLRGVRKQVGDDFPVVFRFSADERISGGRNLEESVAIAPMLVEAGADCLSVSTGTLVHGLTYTVPSMGVPRGLNVSAAAAVKAAVDVPVTVAGKLNDPVLAESVLAAGKADLIAIGRGLIADPEWPTKVREGRWEDICRCISCNQGCINAAVVGAPFCCLVNAEAGREGEMGIGPADGAKRVLVAGGGPAGMEAARVAALRGHDVTLYEQGEHLGGQFRIAALPPLKQEIAPYLQYMGRQLEKTGVKVVLGQKLTGTMVAAAGPDAVVVATGGRPLVPEIPGIDGDNVVKAVDVLEGSAATGRRVLVAGGGVVGCETAEFLDQYGKRVTIVEMLPRLASEMAMGPRTLLLERLDGSRVRVMTSTRIVEFTPDGVVVEHKGHRDTVGGMDTIVLALGVASVNDMADEISNAVPEVHVIGDARKPGTALDAIAAGAEVGRLI